MILGLAKSDSDEPLDVRNICPGGYVVIGAYNGRYEYFSEDTAVKSNSETIQTPCSETEIAEALFAISCLTNSEPLIRVIRRLAFERDMLKARCEEMTIALKAIAAIRWGYEGDCGAVRIAENAIQAADKATASEDNRNV